MTIQEIQTLVQQAPGSIYTREDVISLLNRITFPEPSKVAVDKGDLEALCEIVRNELENIDSYISKDFNTDSYGDSVTIECEVTVDVDDLLSDIRGGMEGFLTSLEELESEEK